MKQTTQKTAYFHLPGLFEFYELYELFLPLFREHREYFYDWCEIGSIYGAPADCIWGGGRIGDGDHSAQEVLHLMQEYGISARLTFSNSLLQEEHLSDKNATHFARYLKKVEQCKWCDCAFGFIAVVSEEAVSGIVSCLINHESSDGV